MGNAKLVVAIKSHAASVNFATKDFAYPIHSIHNARLPSFALSDKPVLTAFATRRV
jgi:hypothetical protein